MEFYRQAQVLYQQLVDGNVSDTQIDSVDASASKWFATVQEWILETMGEI